MVTRDATRGTRAEKRIERVRGLALGLPRALEQSSYGFPVFSIGKGKIFLWLLVGAGSERASLAVRTSGMDEQAMLLEVDCELFFRPRYLGRWNWIGMRLDGRSLDWSQVEARIVSSWIESATPAQLRRYRPDQS